MFVLAKIIGLEEPAIETVGTTLPERVNPLGRVTARCSRVGGQQFVKRFDCFFDQSRVVVVGERCGSANCSRWRSMSLKVGSVLVVESAM
jgi:hypothetical protein